MGWFEMFRDEVTGAPKKKAQAKSEKPKYEWVREARYKGQDTSVEPKQYQGNGRWVKKRVK